METDDYYQKQAQNQCSGTNEDWPTSPAPRKRSVAKRVRRACEYCRRKRLKCTTEEYPCLNCRLYDAKCIIEPRPTKNVSGRRQSNTNVTNPIETRKGASPGAVQASGAQDASTTAESTQDTIHVEPSSSNMMASPPGSESAFPAAFDPGTSTTSGALLPDTLDLVSPGAGNRPMQLSNLPPVGSGGPTGLSIANGRTGHEVLGFDDHSGTNEFETFARAMGFSFSGDFRSWDDPLPVGEGENSMLDPSLATSEGGTCPFDLDTFSPDAGQQPRIAPTPNSTSTTASSGKIFGVETIGREPMTPPLLRGAIAPRPSIAPGLFNRKTSGDSNFIGFCSTGATLAICLRESLNARKTAIGPDSFQFLIDSGPLIDEIDCEDMHEMSEAKPPERSFARQCVEAFFQHHYAFFPIVNHAELRGDLQRFYDEGATVLGHNRRSRLFLVIAIGALEQSGKSAPGSDCQSQHRAIYLRAWSWLSLAVAAPCIISVQALLLHVIYNLHTRRGGIAWTVCGLAVRMAQSCGIHRALPAGLFLEHEQKRLSARLWAVALTLDARLSAAQGRPITCSSAECDIDLVTEDNGDVLRLIELPYPLTEIQLWSLNLALMQQNFCTILNTRQSASSRLNHLAELDAGVSKWKAGLPSEWQPDQQVAHVSTSTASEIYALHVDYFNLIRLIHWTASMLMSSNVIETVHHPRLRASETICLNACLAVVQTLNRASESADAKSWLRSRHDACVASMAIIYRHLIHHPERMSSRTNLEYFRACMLHLEQTDERFSAPSLEKALEDMLKSAEEMIWKSTSRQQGTGAAA